MKLLTDTEANELVTLLSTATDTGWLRRPSGEFSRILKFEKPLPETLYQHMIAVLYVMQAPKGVSWDRGERSERLSSDRVLLHLLIAAPLPEYTTTPAPRSDSLFGLVGVGAA